MEISIYQKEKFSYFRWNSSGILDDLKKSKKRL